MIEIPMGSHIKFEIDKNTGKLEIDRVLNQKIPNNYGYISETLCEDGDPLDIFVVSENPIAPLHEVEVEVYGVLKCKDSGLQDDKLIGYLPIDEGKVGYFGPNHYIRQYLETYKEGFVVESYGNLEEAIRVYEDSVELYNKVKLRI